MADKKEIYDFAYKWILLFQNPMTKESEVNQKFSKECFSLGFQIKAEELQSGELIQKEALADITVLYEELIRISDTTILGNIIFSMWKHLS